MLDKVGSSGFQPQTTTIQPQNQTDLNIGKQTEFEQREKQLNKKDLEKVINGMNEFLKPSTTHIQFQYHEKLQEYYVTVVDIDTQEVVKEIPSKKMLDMHAEMTEFLGVLVDKKI
ncbi:flagellar protein FlaG [Bacillus testis]|uniref:flagellar protein FlaG n=1 Tax=Bacillus testis TaxID=1622072 RepID=UPI00067F5406|nr:flagellar protein FlaG [Bacillus testis]